MRFYKAVLFVLRILPCIFVMQVWADMQDNTLSNHSSPVYTTEQECLEALSDRALPGTPNSEEQIKWADAHLPADLNLLSWNIAKGKSPGWQADIEHWAPTLQLAFLQEATLSEKMKKPDTSDIYWSFSPGYKTKKYASGIMTLSRKPPMFMCSLSVQEPWLKTPKVTSITRYTIGERGASLLVVNMHSVNFTLVVKHFLKQLAIAETIMRNHNGPIIFVGDFNTWSKQRLMGLYATANTLNLSEVNFEPDNRSKHMGKVVDHIFVRGFAVTHSQVQPVTTSDHNPLLVSLSLK